MPPSKHWPSAAKQALAKYSTKQKASPDAVRRVPLARPIIECDGERSAKREQPDLPCSGWSGCSG